MTGCPHGYPQSVYNRHRSLCRCVLAMRPRFLGSSQWSMTMVDDSVRWHHGLEVSVAVLASSFSVISSEMALAEVNSFIAGCQPFCNIHRALHGYVLRSVTDVRAVMYSPWREAGLT